MNPEVVENPVVDTPAASETPVSVPSNAVSVPSNGTVAKIIQPMNVDQDTFLVTVDKLNVSHFVNTRKQFVEQKVLQMRNSIKTRGQQQAVGGVLLENGDIAVVWGYTRTEAFNRNVHEPLVNKFNSDNELTSAKPGFLVVTDPKHRDIVRAAYPEEFEKQKNKPENLVRVTLKENVKNARDALIENYGENFDREDLPLLDQLDGIVSMMENHGLKGKEVAKIFKVSEAQISVLRKARRVPELLKVLIATPKAGPDGKMEEITESDLVKLKEDAQVLVDEILRRMALPKEDREAIPVSHIRELASKIVVAEHEVIPLTRTQITEAACKLAGADTKTRKLIKNKESYNYTMFKAELASYESEWNKRKEAAAKGEVVPPEGSGGVAVPPVQGSEAGTVAGLAADQEAGKAAAVDTVKTDGTTEASVANVGTAVAPAPDTGAKADALLGVTGDTEEVVDETELGARSTRTVAAPESRIKMKSPDLIHSSVKTFISTLTEERDEREEEIQVGIVAGSLQAIAFGYEMLGIDDLRKKYDAKYIQYCDDMETYINAIETYAEEAGKKSKGKPFGLERPVFDASDLVGEGELGPEDNPADDEEIEEGSDVDDEPDSDVEGEE